MDARFYNSEEIDIQRLASDLENVYRARGFQAQQFGSNDQVLVQLKKGGDLEAIIGMQAALSLTIQRTSGGVLAMIGQQRWLDKAAVGAVGIVAMPVLWPLAITAGVGAVRQASLANEVLNIVDGLVRQQKPDVQLGPIPGSVMTQVQQQWGMPPQGMPGQPSPMSPSYVPPYVPPQQQQPGSPFGAFGAPPSAQPAPTPTQLRCPNCNTPYEQGDTYCSGCGRSLAEPKLTCPNCGTELKSDAAFCPKCGASTFQARTQSARPAAPPQAQPQPKPLYTPPPVQSKPPAAPPPRQAPPKPSVQPYATSAPKEPPVVPKPTVTFIPGSSGPDTASAPTVQQPPQEPAIPVYKPPQQPPRPQTPPTPRPIAARPAGPAPDPNALWGLLIFNDGRETQLRGERIVIGRYDHDLGGLKPDIDLGNTEGADTVSRVHAMLEHIGSSYTLTDLNSTNATRINGKRLEPDKATPISDGDTLHFGKITCTFKKA